jgi:hypothetical protein
MTAQKSFKRLVRARMAKTGERYATARAQLLRDAGDDAATDRDVPRLACSDDRIRERTDRGWEEWFDLLDSWDAESMQHTELARRVAELLDVSVLAWDAQAIVASFERSRGMRAVGERIGPDGFVASASKTIAASAESVFAAFVDHEHRRSWLRDLELTERTVAPSKRARFDVDGGVTRLFVSIEPKGAARCTVTVEHSRLAGPEERARRKDEWQRALLVLKADLERDDSDAGSRQ